MDAQAFLNEYRPRSLPLADKKGERQNRDRKNLPLSVTLILFEPMPQKPIDYEHARNLHLISGPQAAFPYLLKLLPARPIDVGRGKGNLKSPTISQAYSS